MGGVPKGEWEIVSILVNRETVLNDDGFRSVEIADDELIIQPSGMSFKVKQSTSENAVLESRGQVFYADFSFSQGMMIVELTRPKLKESVRIEAVFIREGMVDADFRPTMAAG